MSATMPERIFADLALSAPVDTAAMSWLPSPAAGVERKPLDRDGGEFLVLEGVFADEKGRYPAGTYVRNPPGSSHAPFSVEGCVIFVKLRQMPDADRQNVVLDTTAAPWQPTGLPGHWRMTLFASPVTDEVVQLERLAPGTALGPRRLAGGEEILVLDGALAADGRVHRPGTWLRRPAGDAPALSSPVGCRFWVKRGHLPAGEPAA